MTTSIYFYNAFSAPKLVGNSFKEIKENIKIIDSYRGDITCEIKGVVRLWLKDGARDLADIKEALSVYDLFVNPILEDFQDKNKRSGLNKKTYL